MFYPLDSLIAPRESDRAESKVLAANQRRQMNLKFNYAIRNAAGLFYNGNVFGDARDWSAVPMNVYTYSEAGAHRKLALFPGYFAGCSVVRYL